MTQLKTIIAFLVLNFSALLVGGLFTGQGVSSEWYNNLNQAPWTPPGWVFGFAWTSIMICFTFYMSTLFHLVTNKKKLLGLFGLQWILNVIWNPIFFYFQLTGFGLFVICSLTLIVAAFHFLFKEHYKYNVLLLMPYFIWLIVATSLNAFIFLSN